MSKKIRLTTKEITGIQKALAEFAPGKGYSCYLFGSRTDVDKRGGDIDLLLLVDEAEYLWFLSEKLFLITKLKRYVGDQRIDVTITNDKSKDPFIDHIRADLVELVSKKLLTE